jgi:hypothetical protein
MHMHLDIWACRGPTQHLPFPLQPDWTTPPPLTRLHHYMFDCFKGFMVDDMYLKALRRQFSKLCELDYWNGTVLNVARGMMPVCMESMHVYLQCPVRLPRTRPYLIASSVRLPFRALHDWVNTNQFLGAPSREQQQSM